MNKILHYFLILSIFFTLKTPLFSMIVDEDDFFVSLQSKGVSIGELERKKFKNTISALNSLTDPVLGRNGKICATGYESTPLANNVSEELYGIFVQKYQGANGLDKMTCKFIPNGPPPAIQTSLRHQKN